MSLRSTAQRALQLELPIILLIIYIFWIADPNRVWSLLLLLPLLLLRWLAYGRLVTNTPLNIVIIALLVVAALNAVTAPYERGETQLTFPALDWQTVMPWAWVMPARILMGAAIYWAFIEHGRRNSIRTLVAYTVLLGVIVALLALVSSQWNSKSAQLSGIIDVLPQVRDLWLAPGGFNANEIAGGISWLAPLCAGLALYPWRARWVRILALAAFVLLLLALVLGQSRLALTGVIVGLSVVSVLLTRRWRTRLVALAGVLVLTVFELLIISNAFAPLGTGEVTREVMQTRDESGTAGRIEMYVSALEILDDHPWTGVGLNMYRDAQVRERYPVVNYNHPVLPHAHNEFLQLGVDFGYPGLALYIGLNGMTLYMVWICWRRGDRQARVVAISCAGGLLAHGIFGLGDAVALTDRFIFVYWSVLGLLGAQYVLTTHTPVQESQRRADRHYAANPALTSRD